MKLLGLTEEQHDELVMNEAETRKESARFFKGSNTWRQMRYACVNSRVAEQVSTPVRKRAKRAGTLRGCRCEWSFTARRSAPGGAITVSYNPNVAHNEQCLQLQQLGQQYLSALERKHLQHTVDAMLGAHNATILRVRACECACDACGHAGPRVSAARRRPAPPRRRRQEYQVPKAEEYMLDHPELKLSTVEEVQLYWLSHPGSVPRAAAVSEIDIKNAKARSKLNIWKLHTDDATSVNMWVRANEKHVLLYEPPVAGSDQARAFASLRARCGAGGAALLPARAPVLGDRARRCRVARGVAAAARARLQFLLVISTKFMRDTLRMFGGDGVLMDATHGAPAEPRSHT